MRSLAILMTAFLLLAFESPVLHRAELARYAPDIALIFVLYLGLTSRFLSGLLLALGIGLLKDAFTLSTPVGMHMEILAISFLVCFRVSRRLALRGPVGVVVLTVVFSVGASLLELLLSLVFDRGFGASERSAGLILAAMLPQALVTAPFGPVVFWLLERLDQLTSRKSESVFIP